MNKKILIPNLFRRILPFAICALLLFLPLTVMTAAIGDVYRSAPAESSAAVKRMGRTTVFIADINGVVGVPMEEHMKNVFDAAGKSENALLVIRIDTPGGLVDSTSNIMSMIADADFPVVVWVAPSGARAASAGAFILQAAHVAVMAPGTNAGAAHPVRVSGSEGGSEIDRKITNDLAAKMRSFAEERGRDVKAAESMVRESVSLTAREALDRNVIDLMASNEDELLNALDGRLVEVGGKLLNISLDDREISRVEMSPRLRALGIISNPEIAYFALLAGIFLIIIEMRVPGGYLMGSCGVALLLAAAYGLRILPVNLTGLALLAGGVTAIAADLLVGGVGVFAALGIGIALFGGLMLYDAPGGELLRVSSSLIIAVTVMKGVIFLIIVFLASKALRRRPVSGIDGLKGERARILNADGTAKMVFIHGEYWRVEPVESRFVLSPGDEVEVMGVDSMTLRVKPVRSADS
ncbi:MAG: nodulation protein NfeD [Synergistaceae bacterium]|jgi:membrane-bound serine protease (ClpP class)|nr:nodulation protein NfeD [Synergistaceae bacterium]